MIPHMIMFKKADILLTIGLIIIGLAMTWYFAIGKTDAELLRVSVDGKPYGTYALSEDREINVTQNGHTNKIIIQDGTVAMAFSTCHGQDCVKSHSISKTGEQIVCLPNKVVLDIEGGDGGYDSISK